MDVYMDAVLHPNIYKHEEIFRQEGWNYHLEEADGELSYNGVVYNEMKGAFSSPDGVLDRMILNSLFPDTTYANESGGDPDVIPELTYEEYLNFHRTYYHPSNSYIYLYGNMDMEEKLNWLDQEYLSAYDRKEVDSEIHLQKPFEQMHDITKPYSIASNESTEDNTYLSYNKVIGTSLDEKLYLAFQILDYALLSAPGAPITKALLEAGIGKDISGSYDSSTYQPIFSIVAKNANEEKKAAGSTFLTCSLSSSPSIKGILISVIRMSGFFSRIIGNASSPSLASPTKSYPCISQLILFLIPFLIIISSSTKNTFIILLPAFNMFCFL